MRALFRAAVGLLALVGAASISLAWFFFAANPNWRTSEERAIAAITALQQKNDELERRLRESQQVDTVAGTRADSIKE